MANCTVGSLSALGLTILSCKNATKKSLTVTVNLGNRFVLDVCDMHALILPYVTGVKVISIGPLHDDHVHSIIT